MAVTTALYSAGIAQLLGGGIDTAALSVALLTSGSVYDDANETVTDFDLETYEVTGTGYTAGGKALTTVAVDNTAGVVSITADDVVWTATTVTTYAALIYDTDTDVLIAYVDFGAAVVSAADDLTLSLPDGILATP